MTSQHPKHTNRKTQQNIPRTSVADPRIPAGQPEPGGLEGDATLPVVSLGADPGALMASLPAMFGFYPKESLVLIGLKPVRAKKRAEGEGTATSKKKTVTFQVGPVVRADMHDAASQEAITTFTDSLGAPIHPSTPTESCPQSILIAISESTEAATAAFHAVRQELAAVGIPVYESHWASQIADNHNWGTYDLNTGWWTEEGTIPTISHNPMTLHAGVTNALSFDDRQELEDWLEATKPPITPTPGSPQGHKELQTLLDATATVLDGHRTVEDLCADPELISAIANLCITPWGQKFTLLASVGLPSPVLRTLLADSARRLNGRYRTGVLYVLTHVLIANGEGVAAFHTARRGAFEERDPHAEQHNHVLVLAIKLGLALEIIQEKVASAHVDAQKLAAGHGGVQSRKLHQSLAYVVDWDAVANLEQLATSDLR